MRPWTAGQKRFSFRFSQIAQDKISNPLVDYFMLLAANSI
jgi:hypothetical protein